MTALQQGFAAGGLNSCAASQALAFLVEFNILIPANTDIRINYICTAPEYIHLNTETGEYEYNLNKLAVNDATLWYAGYDTKLNPTQTTRSNRTQVTINTNHLATIGQRIWVDLNANGLQDDGEPLYTDSEIKLSLLTYFGSRTNPTTTVQRTDTGLYSFKDLETSIPKYVNSGTKAYRSNGNVDLSKMNGSSYYTYRVSVDEADIPAGYTVTTAYAGHAGSPTLLATAEGDDHILYYSSTDGDGHEQDSDFKRSGTKFQTALFYLPMQSGLEADEQASYPFYDLGLVRIRDLTLTKQGENGKAISNAAFAVYGPFTEDELKNGVNLDNYTAVKTLKTGSDGKAVFTSTDSAFLNYYSYYIIVETAAGKGPYTNEIVGVEGSDFTMGSSYDVSGGVIEKDVQNWFVLQPHTESDEDAVPPMEEVTVTDRYQAEGSVQLDASKALSGIAAGSKEAITVAPFSSLFSFTLTNTVGDDPAFADGAKTLVNNGASILVKNEDGTYVPFTFSYSHDGYLGDSTLEYEYTLTEVDPAVDAVAADPTVYTLHVSVSDAAGNGTLTCTLTFTIGDESKSEVVFTNAVQHGDVAVAKTVEGTDEGSAFTFTVQMTAVEDYEALVYGRTYTVEDCASQTTV